MAQLTRRQLLLGTAATAAGAAMGRAAALPSAKPAAAPALPNPNASGIDHVVVVVMENRSFDHYLGWLPGTDGRQAGLSYPDDFGNTVPTFRLTDWQGCGKADPDHSYDGGRVQLDGGACDGFLKGRALGDTYSVGYYTKDDLAFYGSFVDQATVFDHWFCSILGPTYPNRFYTHAAATDRLDNTMRTSVLPTIWDRLAAAGVPATYYFSDLPFLLLWGEKYIPVARHMEAFFAQAASGTLPAFSYLDPFFLGEDQGGSNDDHPHADIRRGQAFVSLVANAVANSPLWSKTALVVTYDEWGGFFDHVVPPVLPDDYVAAPGEPDHSQAGFRVPSFVLSPFARRGGVDTGTYDHTSILSFLEWRFGLAPLTARDRAARNLAYALDFANPRFDVPSLPVVVDPGPHVCGAPGVGMAAEDPMWTAMRDQMQTSAWRNVD